MKTILKKTSVICIMMKFTLLELLTVIAVIAMLISILAPALSKAKSKVKSIQCISNQRNLFLAISSYCGDFNVLRIPQSTAYAVSSYFSCTLMDTGYLKDNRNKTPQGIFSCPEEKRLTAAGLTEWNTWKGSHYGINWFLGYNPTSNPELRWEYNQNIPVSPSKLMYLGDTEPAWYCHLYYGNERDASIPTYFRHDANKRMNCVFLDGHALNGGTDKIPAEMIIGAGTLGNYYFFCNKNRTTWLDM